VQKTEIRDGRVFTVTVLKPGQRTAIKQTTRRKRKRHSEALKRGMHVWRENKKLDRDFQDAVAREP
jgi:hypothetical protein